MVLSASEGAPGTEIVANGNPLTSAYDTSVRIGDTRARVTDVTRDDCDDCDDCRAEIDCTACETCTDCRSACGSCLQALTFVVPELPEGPTSVIVTNRYGTSAPLGFLVLPAEEEDSGGDSGDSG